MHGVFDFTPQFGTPFAYYSINLKNFSLMKFNIELPFFPGLYESDLYNSDTAYWAIKEEIDYYHNEYCTEYGRGDVEDRQFYEQLTEDDLDFDFQEFSKEIMNNFVSAWKDKSPEIVLSIENEHMWSPRYYNFDTDRIYADVDLRDDWKDVMRAFIKDNYDWLKDRIKKDWTSYDGFMSYMENDIEEWPNHLFEDEDERYISTMLGYMMYRENKDIRNDLVYITLEDVYAGMYVYITDEGKQKLADLKAQWEEDVREGRIVLPDPEQLELDLKEE